MDRFEKRVLDISLVVFLTLVIMNSIKFIGIVTTIGSIGKFLFCLAFIGGVILFVSPGKVTIKFATLKEWGILFSIFIFFAFYFVVESNDRSNLLPNLAFPIYLIFYYLMVRLFVRAYKVKVGTQSVDVIKTKILSLFRMTLFVNFWIWLGLAIATGINMFEVDGGFGGFFQDEIHFGFYVVTGFLISFYFRFNPQTKDTSIFNTALLLLYGGIALLTSRNSFLIIVMALMHHFFISKVKSKFYKVLIYTAVIIGVNFNLFLGDLSEAEVIEITSGRYQIWLLALDDLYTKSYLLFGNGLFNLNDVILNSNRGVGFYYFDDLETLSFHSSYLEVLAGGGLIALIFFFRIISKTWKLLPKIDKSIIAGIMTGATFESFLMQPFMLIACLFYTILIVNNASIKFKLKENQGHLVLS